MSELLHIVNDPLLLGTQSTFKCLFCNESFETAEEKAIQLMNYFESENCDRCGEFMVKIGARWFVQHDNSTCRQRDSFAHDGLKKYILSGCGNGVKTLKNEESGPSAGNMVEFKVGDKEIDRNGMNDYLNEDGEVAATTTGENRNESNDDSAVVHNHNDQDDDDANNNQSLTADVEIVDEPGTIEMLRGHTCLLCRQTLISPHRGNHEKHFQLKHPRITDIDQYLEETDIKLYRCNFCQTPTKNIVRHFQATHMEYDVKQYQCMLCERIMKTKSISNVYKHFRTDHDGCKNMKDFIRPLRTLSTLRESMNAAAARKAFKCLICNEVLKRNEDTEIGAHFRSKHPDCVDFAELWEGADSDETELLNENKIRIYKCSLCEHYSAYCRNIHKHFRREHTGRSVDMEVGEIYAPEQRENSHQTADDSAVLTISQHSKRLDKKCVKLKLRKKRRERRSGYQCLLCGKKLVTNLYNVRTHFTFKHPDCEDFSSSIKEIQFPFKKNEPPQVATAIQRRNPERSMKRKHYAESDVEDVENDSGRRNRKRDCMETAATDYITSDKIKCLLCNGLLKATDANIKIHFKRKHLNNYKNFKKHIREISIDQMRPDFTRTALQCLECNAVFKTTKPSNLKIHFQHKHPECTDMSGSIQKINLQYRSIGNDDAEAAENIGEHPEGSPSL